MFPANPYFHVYDLPQLRNRPEYQDWYRKLSEATGTPADEYLLRLHHFIHRTRTEPHALAKLDSTGLGRLREEFAEMERAEGRSESETARTLEVLSRWLKFRRGEP